MADVSLDDYIVQKGFGGYSTDKGFSGPVRGKVVISNPGVKGRLGGLTTRHKQISPIKWQNTQNRAAGFGQNKQGHQFGPTTKKFTGGLVTKKFSSANHTQQTNVTVTGVGSVQKFDARQKLATKKPVDARAKILEKTKFSDARVRIQNARASKETKGAGPRIQIRSPQSSNTHVRAQIGGSGDTMRMVNTNANMAYGGAGRPNDGGVQLHRGGELKITKSADFQRSAPNFGKVISTMKAPSGYQVNTNTNMGYGGAGRPNDGGVQLHRGGELKITKSADFQRSAPNFGKVISSMKVPSGYEDLFEDEPMSLGSDCSTLIDSDRGPVIKVKNEHFSSQRIKPPPITFNTDRMPERSSYTTSRVSPITVTRSAPLTLTRSVPTRRPSPITHSTQPTYRQADPSTNVRFSTATNVQFSAATYDDEEEMILNAPTPVLPKSRPPPKPAEPQMIGGPPLTLSRSRARQAQNEVPDNVAPVSAPLKLARPTGRLSAPSSINRVIPSEKITLSATSSAVDTLKKEESGSADILSPLQGFRILVTNLHPIVTQDDVIELFGAIGALKKARLIKQGSAEVVYVNKDAAVVAVKKYHNRELDGQPMQVKLITPVTASLPAPKISAEIKALSKSVRDSVGKPSGPPVDTGLIHKALFKTGGAASGAKPVTFTVKI